MKKDLIFLGWNAYGDILSYNGMIRFLLNYFNKIYLRCEGPQAQYANVLFSDISDKVYPADSSHIHNLIQTNNEILVLNTMVAFHMDSNGNYYFGGPSNELSHMVKPENFLWGNNKISDFLNLDEEFRKNELEFVDNSSNFYVNVGLNPKIKTDSFYYERNFNQEDILYQELLSKNNISFDEEYSVICEFGSHIIRDEYKYGKKYINIDWCTSMPLHLGKVLENASEIHLVENSHALFTYYMSVKKLLELKNVNIHIYARNRFEYYHKMMMNPIINTWNFIFE